MYFLKSSLAIAAAMLAVTAQAAPVVSVNGNALALATAIGGSGITTSNATLTTNTTGGNGTFTGGAATVGFDDGIVLTTGTAACAGASGGSTVFCDGGGTVSELRFDFTSTTGSVFFQYVFASEEYNEFVGSQFNDSFALLLNDVNIALIPGGGGAVTINNVNCGSNSAFYRNNTGGGSTTACPNLGLDITYDGLTTVLTASGTVGTGLNRFSFRIADVGDARYDSGVFIRAGSFSSTNPNAVPEPGSLTLVGAALFGLAAVRRRKA